MLEKGVEVLADFALQDFARLTSEKLLTLQEDVRRQWQLKLREELRRRNVTQQLGDRGTAARLQYDTCADALTQPRVFQAEDSALENSWVSVQGRLDLGA